MAANTPTLGMYKPGGGSSGLIVPDEVADIDRLNGNFDILDDEALSVRNRLTPLEDQNRQYRGLAANLGGISGMRLGDEYQETDAGKRLWRYDGSNWLTYEAGLILIRPTTVTGGSVDPDGRIAFSGGQSSLVINGIFSSRFRDYKIEYLLTPSSAVGTSLQLTAGGAAYSGATHNAQRLTAIGSTVSSSSSVSQTAFAGTPLTAIFLSGTWEFKNPSHVGPKFYSTETNQATGIGYGKETGWVGSVDANLYDGIRIAALSGATFNGGATSYIKVYGLI